MGVDDTGAGAVEPSGRFTDHAYPVMPSLSRHLDRDDRDEIATTSKTIADAPEAVVGYVVKEKRSLWTFDSVVTNADNT